MKSIKSTRILTPAARAAMSAGGKKARANCWGAKRTPRAQLSIDADVAERFTENVPARDRRRVASGAIDLATDRYIARRAARSRASSH